MKWSNRQKVEKTLVGGCERLYHPGGETFLQSGDIEERIIKHHQHKWQQQQQQIPYDLGQSSEKSDEKGYKHVFPVSYVTHFARIDPLATLTGGNHHQLCSDQTRTYVSAKTVLFIFTLMYILKLNFVFTRTEMIEPLWTNKKITAVG